MGSDLYSVEQVADLLGLHVRTVRGYIRTGRLKATRIGKQYRIARADLAALTGAAVTPPATPQVEVSSIVQVDGVDRTAADRLGTLILAAANNTGAGPPLRVQTIYDEERARMKIVIVGGAVDTAEALRLLDAVLDAGSGLFSKEVKDA